MARLTEVGTTEELHSAATNSKVSDGAGEISIHQRHSETTEETSETSDRRSQRNEGGRRSILPE